MRLLLCHDCKTLEEVPDFDGPPELDVLLQDLTERHRFDGREPHRGQLMRIKPEDWENRKTREAIIAEVWNKAGYTGMEPEFYATKNTFQEDAAKCFNKHNRPQDGCIDYCIPSKKLGNSTLTREEQKISKDAGFKPRGAVYLCYFCPVQANYVQKKSFEKRGLYG